MYTDRQNRQKIERRRMKGLEAEETSFNEGVDFISTLPDSLLGVIISLLPDSEPVRTCVLSHRWKMVWKHASHLSIDQSQMLKPLIQAYLCGIYLITRLEMAFNRLGADDDHEDLDVIAKAEMMINSLLDSHVGPLKSCTIRHLPESCASGKAVEWIKKLLEKNKVKQLSMEKEDIVGWGLVENLPRVLVYHGRTLALAFEIFSGFEALELKNYYLKTSPSSDVAGQVLKTLTLKNISVKKDVLEGILSCSMCLQDLTLENITHEDCEMMREIKINSPRLKFFRICEMVMNEIKVYAINLEVFEIDNVVCKPQNLTFETPKVHLLRSRCHLRNSGEYFCWVSSNESPQGSPSSFAGIFENLATLCIDFDLKTITDTMTFFSTLKSCPKLQNLEINSRVNDDAVDYYNDQDYADNARGYYSKKEPCECVDHQLKTLSIRGYEGKRSEVEFVKYIITSGEVMEKITIWFVDDCSWVQAAETGCLLSFWAVSPNLSITLNPGPVYMANVDDNFKTWLSTLRG
ncbi:F-box protein At1g80960-like [Cajanus cajan]|uniref:F-box protein At1g80960-like n=1 Tax=Cajanus cajan TaxID=3821 RepID=UPI00098DD544|nr:F-box protein At1g80960-like [Cajanus cajan]